MTAGHLGEWIATQVFDIDLEISAVTATIGGRSATGPHGQYEVVCKREGMVDITESSALDYYLVLAGPASVSSPAQAEPLKHFVLT